MRHWLTAMLTATIVSALAASPASAQREKTEDDIYHATIDCGGGSVRVRSTDDLFAPLVAVGSGRTYRPVAWRVVVRGRLIKQVKKGARVKRAVRCSYDDGVAKGTVSVMSAHPPAKRRARFGAHAATA